MKICIYGASSNKINKSYIDATEKLGEALGEKGHTLVYGGGAGGLMGAAARGFKKKGGKVIGLAPSFFNVDGVLFEECDEFIYPDTMRDRKRMMEDLSDAFIAVPGGIGTFDELFEIVTLRQLGCHQKPVALFNVNGYYNHILEMFDFAVKEGFITEKIGEIVPSFTTAEEIMNYFENYNPSEYVFSDFKSVDAK